MLMTTSKITATGNSWMVATVFIRIATISNREQMFAHCAICLRLEVRDNA